MASLPISLRISQTGTTQTAGARNKGGNFIGQLCISVVPHCHELFWAINVTVFCHLKCKLKSKLSSEM